MVSNLRPANTILATMLWLLIVPLTVAPGAARGAVEVCISGCPFTVIQDAIDSPAALLDPNIAIGPGTYNENLVLSTSISLIGSGANNTIIDGQGLGRVITMNTPDGHNFLLQGLTIQGGDAGTGDGGGVFSSGPGLTIRNSIIKENHAVDGGGVYHIHPGVNTAANLTLDQVDIHLNTSFSHGGGLYVTKSSPYDGECTVNITDSLVHSNIAAIGGGIGSGACRLNIDRTTVTLNAAVLNAPAGGGCPQGGGIASDIVVPGAAGFPGLNPSLNLHNSTVSDNSVSGTSCLDTAEYRGGGIFVIGATLTLDSSTVSGNRIDDNRLFAPSVVNEGAGIWFSGGDLDYRAALNNSTVSSNWFEDSDANDVGSAIFFARGDGMSLNNATVAFNDTGNSVPAISSSPFATVLRLFNSIVGPQMSGSNCALDPATLVTANYSLDSDSSCGLPFGSNISGVDPKLSRLLNVSGGGGQTKTHELLEGSPAIDTGEPFGCFGDLDADDIRETLLNRDQNGLLRADLPGVGNERPLAVCDRGAVEFDVLGFNLLRNGGMESDFNGDTLPDNWIGVNLRNTDRRVCRPKARNTGLCGFVMRAKRNREKEIFQTVTRSGVATDWYRLSLWNAGKNVEFISGEIHIGVRLELADGTVLIDSPLIAIGPGTWRLSGKEHADFLAGIDGYERITVYLKSFGSKGLIAVDDIRLVPLL